MSKSRNWALLVIPRRIRIGAGAAFCLPLHSLHERLREREESFLGASTAGVVVGGRSLARRRWERRGRVVGVAGLAGLASLAGLAGLAGIEVGAGTAGVGTVGAITAAAAAAIGTTGMTGTAGVAQGTVIAAHSSRASSIVT